MTTRRLTPICGAAMPAPLSARMVSFMSATSAESSESKRCTGAATCLSSASPILSTGRTAMQRNLSLWPLPQRIGDVGAALPHGRRGAASGIDRGLVLGLGVERRSEHDCIALQVEPHDEDDHATESAVSHAVAVEIAHIEGKEETRGQP